MICYRKKKLGDFKNEIKFASLTNIFSIQPLSFNSFAIIFSNGLDFMIASKLLGSFFNNPPKFNKLCWAPFTSKRG